MKATVMNTMRPSMMRPAVTGNYDKTLLMACCIVLFSLTLSYAQENISGAVPGFQQGQVEVPHKEHLPEPEFDRDAPASGFKLPPVKPPERGTDQDLSSVVRIFVTAYRFTGNTVFSDRELADIAKPYTGRTIDSNELHELRYRLTRHYIDNGYITSGVILPDQPIKNATITFQVIEGHVQKIDVRGNKYLADGYIEKRLALGATPPLRVQSLQKQIQIIHQNRHIQKLDVEIKPGLRIGESELSAVIFENKPYNYGISYSNHRSPSVGSHQGEIHGRYHNLTGWGDTIGGRLEFTEGLNTYAAHYSIPVTQWDTAFKILYERSDSTVVEAPFDEIDIESDSETYHVSIKHPLRKTPRSEVALTLAFEHRRSQTYLLNEAFSFSPGVENGESQVSPFRISIDWRKQRLNQVVAFRTTVSYGSRLLDATVHANLPDGEFISVVGQFQWAGRFERLKNTLVIFRSDIQLADDALLPMEKFSVGGADSVRGYRENQLVRDQGADASIEIRIPLLRLPLPQISNALTDGILQGAVFYDWGWSKSKSGNNPTGSEIIHSAGMGLRWAPSGNYHAELYWAHPFNEIDNASGDLQDEGIHFRINCHF